MNVVKHLERHAAERPDHPALVFEDRVWTYREVEERISRLATGFRSLGLAAGDRLAVMLPNWPEFHLASHAAWKLGAVEVPVNVMYREEEVEFILQDSGARVAIAHPEGVARILAVRDRLPDLRAVVAVGGAGAPPEGAIDVAELEARGEPRCPAPDLTGDDLAVIAYTSGTTGFPKGSMLGQYHVELSMERLRDKLGLTRDDNVLQVLPCFHSNASLIGIVFGWYLGSTAILVERFDAAEFAGIVARTRPTFFAGVPTLLYDIMYLDDDVPVDFSSVRYVTYGAASAPPHVRRKVEDRFGLRLRQAWGMTEAPTS